jgi:oligopeptide/dipeptide ABC transporter ATP-binding protein
VATAFLELGEARGVLEKPLHPYTKALISAVPVIDPTGKRARQRILLPGDPPSPMNPPVGCRFHPRCPFVIEASKANSAVQRLGRKSFRRLYPRRGN